MIIKNYQYNWF